jgi:hypothetical protein
MISGIFCSGSKSCKSGEAQGITLQMSIVNLFGRESLSEIAVVEVASIEGRAKAIKEGK